MYNFIHFFALLESLLRIEFFSAKQRSSDYSRAPTKLREGNVFRGICLSTRGGRSPPLEAGPLEADPHPSWKEHGTRQEVTS